MVNRACGTGFGAATEVLGEDIRNVAVAFVGEALNGGQFSTCVRRGNVQPWRGKWQV